MFDGLPVLAILLTFLFAGAVKGVIGLGLPTITLAILAVILDLPQAMALLLAPSLATNLWQAVIGGNLRRILLRLWPFLAPAFLVVWLGAEIFATTDHKLLTIVLGASIALYAGLNLAGVRISLSRQQERWAAPIFGAANGLLTGVTGSFVVPGLLFLQAIGLPRDMLVQAMGVLFSLSTLALGLALQSGGYISPNLGLASLAGVIPALIGMALGQRIRKRLPEAVFRKVFFVGLLCLGFYLITRAI